MRKESMTEISTHLVDNSLNRKALGQVHKCLEFTFNDPFIERNHTWWDLLGCFRSRRSSGRRNRSGFRSVHSVTGRRLRLSLGRSATKCSKILKARSSCLKSTKDTTQNANSNKYSLLGIWHFTSIYGVSQCTRYHSEHEIEARNDAYRLIMVASECKPLEEAMLYV